MLGNLVKSIARGLAALAMLAVGGVILLLAVLWWEHKTEITLPEPTGHFAVGRTTYTWVNNAEPDELAPAPRTKREVVVWSWNPSTPATSTAQAGDWPQRCG